jgi:hypothetical protein
MDAFFSRPGKVYATNGEKCTEVGTPGLLAVACGEGGVPHRAEAMLPGGSPVYRCATSRLGDRFLTENSRVGHMTSLDKPSSSFLRGAGRCDLERKPPTHGGKERNRQPHLIGARLHHYIMAWAAIGGAYLIARGLQPEWKGGPPPSNLNQKGRTAYTGVKHVNYCDQLHQEVEEGIVRKVKRENCKFLSPTFIVPKKRGEWRKVMDCREINSFIRDQTFQMEDWRTAQQLIECNQWAVSIDITKAYHHVPVSTEMRSYLAFGYAGEYYQYYGMPFGIKTAPRIFTQIMKTAMKEIGRRWEISSIQYLDDLLFLHHNGEELRKKIIQIADFLQSLGWSINWDKSNITPRQQFLFLGIEWNTSTMQLSRRQRCFLYDMESLLSSHSPPHSSSPALCSNDAGGESEGGGDCTSVE